MYLNSYVSIALLPRQGAYVAEGRVCRVSGWGYTSPSGGQIPSTLRTITLPIVSTEKCNSSESFNGNITENMLCAGFSTGGKDACQVRGPQPFYSVCEYVTFWRLPSYFLNQLQCKMLLYINISLITIQICNKCNIS